MKKWLVVLALCLIPSMMMAASNQPPFDTSDPAIDENFREIYYANDETSAIANETNDLLTTNTSGQILVGQGVGVNPVWQSTTSFNFGKILQISTFTTTTSSATTSSTFVPTNSTLSFTLQNANSRVFVISTGALLISTNDAALAGLYRGSTALHSASAGQCQNVNPTAGATQGVQCTMFAWDTPGTVGPHTYTVRISRSSAGTATYGNGSTASLTIFELGQ